MDAIKFIKEKVRMCDSFAAQGQKCTGCPLAAFDGCDLDDLVDQDRVEEAVELVEEWSAAHPLKTRQSEFLKHYPTARIDENGCLDVYPCVLCDTYRNKYGGCANDDVGCSECRKDFWSQEV